MKKFFEKVVRHVAEWSPNEAIRKSSDFQPGFIYDLDPLMDAVERIPSGCCTKLESSGGVGDVRCYLVYPDFRFRAGV